MTLNVDLLHADKHFSYKLISTLLVSKFPTRYCHYWWRRSNILKELKVASLQYLYYVWKKKLGVEFIFCKQIKHQFFYKLVGLLSLMGVARYVQSTGNKKLIIFLQYLKNCHDCFCVLLWFKTFRCFTRDQSCLLLLVLVTVPAQVVAIHKFNTKEPKSERKTTYVEVH